MADTGHASTIAGAIVSISINSLLIFLFLARLKGMPRVEFWLGMAVVLHILPLLYLLVTAARYSRPAIYTLQIGLILAFLLLELLLDYLLKINFRQNTVIVIAYITLFYAGTGGLVGVASRAGKGWIWPSAISFLLMTALSLYQRQITGQ